MREVVCAAEHSTAGTPFPNGTLALVPNVLVIKNKNIYIFDLGGMHTNNKKKKPRTQDFTWFSKSLHPRSAPALNSHYSINEYNSEELYSFKFTNSY